MWPRAVLRASDSGVEYPLAPKVTTIGREGCDISIQNGSLDFQHALVEYVERENSFVLQDLNTAQGTYVNDCRIQNAAVRLTSGDKILFGYSGPAFSFTVIPPPGPPASSIQVRPMWQQSPTGLDQPGSQGPNQAVFGGLGQLPQTFEPIPVEPLPPPAPALPTPSQFLSRSRPSSVASASIEIAAAQSSVSAVSRGAQLITDPIARAPSVPLPSQGPRQPSLSNIPRAPTGSLSNLQQASRGVIAGPGSRPLSATLASQGGTSLQRPTENFRRLSLRSASAAGGQQATFVDTQQLNLLDLGKTYSRAAVGPVGRSPFGLSQPAAPIASVAAQKPPLPVAIDTQAAIEERDRRISSLTGELVQRDQIIEDMSVKIDEIQQSIPPDADFQTFAANQRLVRELETELQQRGVEVASLRDQLSRQSSRQASLPPTPPRVPSRQSPLAPVQTSAALSTPFERVIEMTSARQNSGSPVGSARSGGSSRTFLVKSVAQNGRVLSPALHSASNLNANAGVAVESQLPPPAALERSPSESDKIITQLQKDLADRNAQIASLKYEVLQLKKDVQEKDVEVSAMHAKASRLRDMRQLEEEHEAREKELIALRQKFKAAENRVQELLDRLQQTCDEVDHQKSVVSERDSTIKRLELELEEKKGSIESLRREERSQDAEITKREKIHDHFRTRILQLTSCIPGVVVPEEEISDDKLVEFVRKLLDERSGAVAKAKELQANVQTTEAERTRLMQSVRALQSAVSAATEHLVSAGRLVRHLRQEANVLSAHRTEDESVLLLRDTVIAFLQAEINWSQDTESALERSGASVRLTEQSYAQHVVALQSKINELVSAKEFLQVKVNTSDDKLQEELRKQSTKLHEEHQAAMSAAVEREQLLAEERLRTLLEEVRTSEKSFQQKSIENERLEQESLKKTIADLKQALEEQHKEHVEKSALSQKNIEDLEVRRKEVVRLESELATLKQSVADAERAKLTVKAHADSEVSRMTEQVAQLTSTVKSAEQKIKSMTKLTHEYELEISKLREKAKLVAEFERRPQVSPVEFAKLERALVAMRNENASLQDKLSQSNETIEALRSDLKGANARLSDMHGELSEEQKQELERNRERVRDLEAQLKAARAQVATSSTVSEEKVVVLNKRDDEVARLKETISVLEEKLVKRQSDFKELESRYKEVSVESTSKVEILENEAHMSAELCAAGAQCRGERHLQVIARQREALNELRSRIKVLEQLRPGSKGDAVIAQVVALKKELAELKAARGKDAGSRVSAAAAAAMAHGAGGGQESLEAMITPDMMELQMEKQAHLETFATLDMSEQCYLTLLRAMASSLELESITGMRAMTHMPADERAQLLREREQSVELLCNRIKIFKDSITRKDEMLNEHEKTLARLSQSEDLATKRQMQIEKLLEELRAKAEECELLREYVSKLREQLEQEKRTAAALRKWQDQKGSKEPPPAVRAAIQASGADAAAEEAAAKQKRPHLCPTPDMIDRVRIAARTELEHSERMKKKEYQMKQLRDQLAERDRRLQDASTRINALETTLGLADSDLAPVPGEAERQQT